MCVLLPLFSRLQERTQLTLPLFVLSFSLQAECVEDEDESVEKSARAVLVVLEALVGPLGAFLGDE